MNLEIAERRLENQRITRVVTRRPADVVSWLGAVQAQEYDAAKWAIGLPREHVSDRYEILHHGGGGAPTTVICGAVRFDHPTGHRLVPLLPKVISVDAWSSPELDWIQSTLRLMAVEAKEQRPGGETVITRLADILVIQAVRSWIAKDPTAQTGWLGALQDKQIGRAIALVHREPVRPWTGVAGERGRNVPLGVCRAIHGAGW